MTEQGSYYTAKFVKTFKREFQNKPSLGSTVLSLGKQKYWLTLQVCIVTSKNGFHATKDEHDSKNFTHRSHQKDNKLHWSKPFRKEQNSCKLSPTEVLTKLNPLCHRLVPKYKYEHVVFIDNVCIKICMGCEAARRLRESTNLKKKLKLSVEKNVLWLKPLIKLPIKLPNVVVRCQIWLKHSYVSYKRSN